MEIEHSMELISTLLFATAVFHTFNCSRLQHLSHRFEPGSVRRNLFHFLGEVEVVFGIWAAIFILIWGARYGIESAATYLRQINYTEALFVFVIMCMSATRPILYLARAFIGKLAGFLKLSQGISTYITTLVVGPLLGALITEPAAMTVTALLLKESFFSSKVSQRFKYATLGLLFVNVSIGGTLTHFAAPPVLMVARAWQWNTLSEPW
jgi:hypothetical protein